MVDKQPRTSLAMGALLLGVAAVIGSLFVPDNDDSAPHSADVTQTPTATAAKARALPLEAEAEPSDMGVKPNTLAGELADKQTVSAALEANGMSAAQVDSVVRALRGIYDFRFARPGARFEVSFEETGELKHFTFEHSALEVYEVNRTKDGKLSGQQVLVPITTKIEAVGATVKSSLYQAMKDAGEAAALVSRVTDVFAWDLDFFRNTHPGDTFRVIVEKHFKDDEFVRYGRIIAAQYEGKAGLFRTFWFEPTGSKDGHYFLESGESAEKSFLATPLKFTRISSGFNKKRKHPILGYTKAHLGVDYAAPTGTPVWAMASGKVTFAGWKGPNGRLVRIDHENGLTSAYAHLHRIARGVKRGVRVRQKQVIGYVGSTGRSTGPHLHFGVRKNGRYINPRTLKMTRGKKIAKKDERRFKKTIAGFMTKLDAIKVGTSPGLSGPQ